MTPLSNSNAGSKDTSFQIYGYLRMPTFYGGGQEENNHYLKRFERLDIFYEWDKDDYHVCLTSLLRGRVLKVFVCLCACALQKRGYDMFNFTRSVQGE